jgi:DNA polymerase-3 subunit delta'
MPLTASDAFSLLRNAKAQNRLAHAYLITGPQGSGKRRLAEQLCEIVVEEKNDVMRHPDVHVVEPESKSRRIVIDQIRELERTLQMRSARGGRKAGVIFDADRLQPQASNAFLKTLEEPPAGTHLILVSSLPDQLLETILSRCIEVPLHPTERRALTPRQRDLLAILRSTARRDGLDLPEVFGLVRDFQKLLSDAREAAQAQSDAELKAEELRYKQFADAKWFEDREDYFKALTEARYVAERVLLLETLEAWQADILRQQAGFAQLDLPDLADETATLARRCSPAKALRCAGALETLREQLGNPGIQEQLAIESAFLKTFGGK